MEIPPLDILIDFLTKYSPEKVKFIFTFFGVLSFLLGYWNAKRSSIISTILTLVLLILFGTYVIEYFFIFPKEELINVQ
ncbi:MAG: hypothetical protein HQK79_09850 [Desulfobacterales bacterium]|nr:hypothetical protein [Desulfobacterales bacterium]MBF0398748.1 hypothetical protein [Desulfobacterales bacterium]